MSETLYFTEKGKYILTGAKCREDYYQTFGTGDKYVFE